MAPQGLENIESAPEHGATARIVNREPAACRLRSKVEKPNASRPETAPQAFETKESAPENGAAGLRALLDKGLGGG